MNESGCRGDGSAGSSVEESPTNENGQKLEESEIVKVISISGKEKCSNDRKGTDEDVDEEDNDSGKRYNTKGTAVTSTTTNSTVVILAVQVQDEETNGESAVSIPVIKLPENLEGLIRADTFPSQRHRWNTNEEIAAILISFGRHPEWLSKEVKIRPKSGSMLLYSRKKVRYRRDGYCWKKRKDGKTTREDHMKLKVQGTECIYGCYVHSAILPTFHRRCYWLLQNPDIVLVHYLNVPYPDDNKLIITSNVSMWGDKKEWTKEELISQLKPMFFSEEEPDLNNELELSTAETVEAIVHQLMEKQRLARQAPALDNQQQQQPPTIVSVANPPMSINNCSTNGGPTKLNTTCQSSPIITRVSSTTPNSAPTTTTTPSTHLTVQIPTIPLSLTTTGVSCTTSTNNNNNTNNHLSINGGGGGGTTNNNCQPLETTHRLTLQNLNGVNVNGGGADRNNGPFVLNLSQFQTAGGLIILNGKPAAAVSQSTAIVSTSTHQHQHHSTLAAVQSVNTGPVGTTVTSTLAATLMDIQNANVNVSMDSTTRPEGLRGGNTVSVGTGSLISNSNQTLFIHQHQPHFTTSSMTTTNTKVSHRQPMSISGSGMDHHHHNQHHHHHVHQTVTHQQHQHQTTPQHQQQQQANGFFHQETLDMSHEDIQQTLSANMSHMVDSSVDLEPMSPSADDVFVNLDAFDILADLSEDLEQQHHMHNGTLVMGDKNTIVDINPEWAYSEGGTKVLIVGQFHNAHWDYTVHFGDFAVPAVYLQTGVLKCFCPPHNPGLVPIRVYSSGKQISSNSMVFEYKADLRLSLVPVPPSETSLKLCLIHRMECLEKCFRNFKPSDMFGVKSLEDCVVKICCEMMAQEWTHEERGTTTTTTTTTSDPSLMLLPCDRGLTLLHVSAALGYARLLLTLVQRKRENTSPILDLEVNPLKTDDFGLIPLMWSARYGHLECGIILAQWSPESLQRRDPNGHNSIQIAVSRGHAKFATELEKIQRLRNGNNKGIVQPEKRESENFITTVGRLRRYSNSVSEDFGLKDCFFGQPDATLELSMPSEEESRVLTLAEQIIAAMPERIKKESCEDMSPSDSQDSSSIMSSDPSEQNDYGFEFSDRNYRYYDSGTPCSSLSPSSSCLQSPCSSTFTVDSPQPTTADFCEFLQASAFEKEFSNLTLSDREQRELYEAAKVIQKAYRSYKGRKKLEEEEKDKVAAVIIQNYYRRYKQYAYLRQVTQAALVIQNQFRNYCEHKRFKKSQECDSSFRLLREAPTNAQSILRTYSQRRQNQAAKKIQQFMRQSKNKLQRERAEKEKQPCR